MNETSGPDIDDIEARTPILDAESGAEFTPDKIEQQWQLLSEAMRRQILENPETRQLAIEFIDTPVSETLPGEFTTRMSQDERVGRLLGRYETEVGGYLGLDPVPDDIIKPDIANAPSFEEPKSILERWKKYYGDGTSEYHDHIRRGIEEGYFSRGLTGHERLMVKTRYRFARDVKLLALGAEVLEQEGNLVPDENGQIELQSGTRITLNTENAQDVEQLVSPQSWEKRRQIKDRVYEIQVGDSTYILKEKKTDRHTDTMRHGHKPGVSSLEEFEAAKFFVENATLDQGDLKVSWETPLATVEFPDGFQFTVFKHEPGLMEQRGRGREIVKKIKEHQGQFQAEYEVIKELSEKYSKDPRVDRFEDGNTESGLKSFLKFIGLRKEESPEKLSFEEFAIIKAYRLQSQAKDLMHRTILEKGYSNRDMDGYAFRVNEEDERFQLELIGFDFEYYQKISAKEAKEILDRREKHRYDDHKSGLNFLYWTDLGAVTPQERAGYLAMLELEGLLEEDEEY